MASWETGSWLDTEPLYIKYRPLFEEKLRTVAGYENVTLTTPDLDTLVSFFTYETEYPDRFLTDAEREEWNVPEGLELPLRDDGGDLTENAFIFALEALDPPSGTFLLYEEH